MAVCLLRTSLFCDLYPHGDSNSGRSLERAVNWDSMDTFQNGIVSAHW